MPRARQSSRVQRRHQRMPGRIRVCVAIDADADCSRIGGSDYVGSGLHLAAAKLLGMGSSLASLPQRGASSCVGSRALWKADGCMGLMCKGFEPTVSAVAIIAPLWQVAEASQLQRGLWVLQQRWGVSFGTVGHCNAEVDAVHTCRTRQAEIEAQLQSACGWSSSLSTCMTKQGEKPAVRLRCGLAQPRYVGIRIHPIFLPFLRKRCSFQDCLGRLRKFVICASQVPTVAKHAIIKQNLFLKYYPLIEVRL
eukprot:SAG31_NODE_3378_length_4344_cov_7.620259_1_plen_251_part_00